MRIKNRSKKKEQKTGMFGVKLIDENGNDMEEWTIPEYNMLG